MVTPPSSLLALDRTSTASQGVNWSRGAVLAHLSPSWPRPRTPSGSSCPSSPPSAPQSPHKYASVIGPHLAVQLPGPSGPPASHPPPPPASLHLPPVLQGLLAWANAGSVVIGTLGKTFARGELKRAEEIKKNKHFLASLTQMAL